MLEDFECPSYLILLLFSVLSEELLFSVKRQHSNDTKKQALDYLNYLKHYSLLSLESGAEHLYRESN